MKVISKYWGDKYFVTGNKKFKLFFVIGNLLSNPKLQEEELFSLSSWCSFESRAVFNSGERRLRIRTNTTEEFEELFDLFQENGFKVRKHPWGNKNNPKSSETFLTEENFEGTMNLGVFDGGEFNLILVRKQFPKFQKFLRTLSKVYGYKTQYLVGIPNTRLNSIKKHYNFIIK